MVTITAQVEDIVFKNEETGFAVLEMSDTQGSDYFTAVGELARVMPGETLVLSGTWVKHREFGEQLKVYSYSSVAPSTKEGIVRYLSSGFIPGVGIATAGRIVDAFGEDTLEIIEKEPQRLYEVEGLGKKKIPVIVEALAQQLSVREVMLFLQTYSVSASMAAKIYKIYGRNTVNIVKENPYRLAEDVDGIGFPTADKIARLMGVEYDSPFRIDAAIFYVLKQAASNAGHTYLPQNELIDGVKGAIGVKAEDVESKITAQVLIRKIILDTDNLSDERRYYLPVYYYSESYCARRLTELNEEYVSRISHNSIEKYIQKFQRKNGVVLNSGQKEAVLAACDKPVSIITGGPGTGKTTLIKCLIDIFTEEGDDVSLAAPTGRAAKRMSEATGIEAKTIHRLLEYDFSTGEKSSFRRNEANPLDCSVLILDEVSMVDMMLMYFLMKALVPGTRLVLVGDADQLPSVGAGDVLADMIESKIFTTVKLTEIYRQEENSAIVSNAHLINRGEYPVISSSNGDFFLIKRDDADAVAKTVCDLVVRRLPDYYGFDPMKDIEVLSPAKKGTAGVRALNNLLQASLNPDDSEKKSIAYGDTVFREGDKIMQVKNNYSIEWVNEDTGAFGEGIFNGDIGVIEYIDNENGYMRLRFDDGKSVDYDTSLLDQLELAYAVTVHKSQGNEFPAVVIPLTGGSKMLYSRNLLYTAITRAQRLVVIVGREDVLNFMVENNYVRVRYTGLALRLIDGTDNEITDLYGDMDNEKSVISDNNVTFFDWDNIDIF
ncbi:MAG: ATP-dependent RecD-like DNA helicase [Clostridiales bacterium]|nr:ATP-dependent RecD-like DNA helicase [Clostridiales bacterium]